MIDFEPVGAIPSRSRSRSRPRDRNADHERVPRATDRDEPQGAESDTDGARPRQRKRERGPLQAGGKALLSISRSTAPLSSFAKSQTAALSSASWRCKAALAKPVSSLSSSLPKPKAAALWKMAAAAKEVYGVNLNMPGRGRGSKDEMAQAQGPTQAPQELQPPRAHSPPTLQLPTHPTSRPSSPELSTDLASDSNSDSEEGDDTDALPATPLVHAAIHTDIVEFDTEEAALGWRREVQAALYIHRYQRGSGRGHGKRVARIGVQNAAGATGDGLSGGGVDGEEEDTEPGSNEGVRISIPLKRIKGYDICTWYAHLTSSSI